MTRDQRARQLLKDLQGLSRQMALYPTGHPTTGEALTAATQSAEGLASGAGGEVVLSLLTDSFYLDRTLLAHASLESSALLRTMQGRGIESITFLSPVAGAARRLAGDGKTVMYVARAAECVGAIALAGLKATPILAWLLKEPPSVVLLGLALLSTVVLLLATRVAHHADELALRLGEPYGTLILTGSATVVELALIASTMTTGEQNPTLARDA